MHALLSRLFHVRSFTLWLLVFRLALTPCAADSLWDGFARPPRDARPWVYWFVMDGNLSREGITADFEAMHQAGLGGLIMMEVDVGIPKGPVAFMGEEWQGLFAHAVQEAERLGLEITLNAGPGWTGSGGPWVKPEQSMQHLVASRSELTGPGRLSEPLPRPARRPAFFGDGQLPAALEQAKNDYYREIAVLAFPTPAVREPIPDLDERALYLRAPYSSQPGVRAWFPTSARAPEDNPAAAVDPVDILDLSARLGTDGRLDWDAPPGRWTILRFGCTSTGANTRPAPRPGLGLESDKFDPAALEAHFDAFVTPLLERAGPRAGARTGWTSLHIDSWEMGAQNWTAAYRDEFLRRRGYDLLPFLPVIAGDLVGSREVSERFLWDWRQTAQELVLENHARRLRDLAHANGLGLSIEPYDMNPCADLSLGAVADVPMAEFWLYGFDTAYSVVEAVSVAHTTGRRVVAAEAFTSSDQERWQAHPASMKARADWAFAAGLNRLVIHRYQHQPWLDRFPGMTMGPYGVHWERTQTWWDMVPAFHNYLARCQFLLRQGLPVADVCFLAAEGAPHVFRPPASALHGDPPDRTGYGFDGCAPEVLLGRADVHDGCVTFPDGMRYRVLVLPESPTMTPRLLRRVKELVAAGARVIGSPPQRSPGLQDYPACDAEVRGLAQAVWGDGDGRQVGEHSCGKGRVVWERSADLEHNPDAPLLECPQYGDFSVVVNVLRQMGVPPDFEASVPLRYVHRRLHDGELYFVANPADFPVRADATFRVTGREPELWDPVTAGRRVLPRFSVAGGRTVVPLEFEAHQSFFLVFRERTDQTSGTGSNFTAPQPLGDILGPWDVSFDPRWGGPGAIRFASLVDWTLREEPGIRHYSGVATYHNTFKVSEPALAGRVLLDLGVVHNLAGVRLNGIDLGVVWCAPWRLDITDALQSGENRIEIRVANLWPNRLIGDSALSPDERLTWTTWNPFRPDSALLPSGLLGPVTLLTMPATQ